MIIARIAAVEKPRKSPGDGLPRGRRDHNEVPEGQLCSLPQQSTLMAMYNISRNLGPSCTYII